MDNFNVRVTSAPAVISNDLQRETTALGSDGSHLRVATFNVENLDPEVDVDIVPNTARPAKLTAALSNSFGFGGHNSALLIKKFD